MTRGRASFQKHKKLIIFMKVLVSFFGERVNEYLFKKSRFVEGKLGFLLRYLFLSNICKSVGDNVAIYTGVYILNARKIDIGDNVSIHPTCYIDGFGGLEIGNNVSIAHGCSILTFEHTWSDAAPIKYNPSISKPVYIRDDVWIGCGVRVLAGVTISSRSVLAAGAVVTKNVGKSSVYGGVPAQFIKHI